MRLLVAVRGKSWKAPCDLHGPPWSGSCPPLWRHLQLLSPFTGSSCSLECSSRSYMSVSLCMKSWLRCYSLKRPYLVTLFIIIAFLRGTFHLQVIENLINRALNRLGFVFLHKYIQVHSDPSRLALRVYPLPILAIGSLGHWRTFIAWNHYAHYIQGRNGRRWGLF